MTETSDKTDLKATAEALRDTFPGWEDAPLAVTLVSVPARGRRPADGPGAGKDCC